MSCTNCDKSTARKVADKVKNIATGYTKLIIKDSTTEELAAFRLGKCYTCPNRLIIPIASIDVCKKCGCVLEAKTRAKDEQCPISLW